jgi:streptogramin lyase
MKVSSRASRLLLVGVGSLIGVAVGAVMTDASGSHGSSSFVPMTPCRLMDTRSTSQVGPRGTPIGAGELYSATVWGTNGNCTIPSTATAISLNVTFVSPTSAGFVAVYPPDKPNPGTSNLNFVAGQAPAPNGVTSPLSFDGKIGFFNAAGTVNLIADIVGYYEQAGSAPGGIVAGNCSAILRWDLPECKKATFATGDFPRGVAFDGANLWVTNQTANTVSKINPATGTKVDFPTGLGPTGIAFDGTSIWVVNSGSDSVSKFNPLTGAATSFPTGGTAPVGIAYDGTYIWVTNVVTDNVSRLNPATGAAVGGPFAAGDGPTGIAYDGTIIWITDFNTDRVRRINPATGVGIGPLLVTGNAPNWVSYDGTNIWVVNVLSDDIYRFNPINGLAVGVPLVIGDQPQALAFDGTNIWATNSADDTLVKINAVTLDTVYYLTGNNPYGVAFDGSNVWVLDRDDDAVMKIVP